MTRLALIVPESVDAFSAALADALEGAWRAADVAVARTTGPPPAGHVPVLVAPDEPVAWDGASLVGAVLLGWQRPGTASYESAARARPGARFELEPATADRLRWLDVAAEPLVPGPWAGWQPAPARKRDLDVVLVGRFSDRRAMAVAGWADALAGRRCALHLLRPGDRVDAPALYARARVVVHVHDGEWSGFPWLTAVQAGQAGAALVCEHSSGAAPLGAEREVRFGAAGTLAHLAGALLDDEPARAAQAAALARAVGARPGLEHAAAAVHAAAGRLAAAGADARLTPRRPAPPRVRDPAGEQHRIAEKRARLADLAARRAAADPGGDPAVVLDRGRDGSPPAVSVLMTVFQHEAYVAQALAGVGAGSLTDLELIVVDDASTDASTDVVAAWLADNDDVPALLLRQPANRGLPVARNAALAHARAPLVLVHDSDNVLLPGALARLAAALDADPGAAFAYGALQMFTDEGAVLGLRSWEAWDPAALRDHNPVDAMAMIRAAVVRGLGGWTTDARLHGWEDYDLWCAVAETGGRGVQAPEVVGRYRVAQGSMLSLTDLSHVDARAALAERHPVTMGAAPRTSGPSRPDGGSGR